MSGRRIEIVEVGPRDGLQNEAVTLQPAVRLEFIDRLEKAGARRMEVVSFVHPGRVPQMAGAEQIMAALAPAAGRRRIGLVLNLRGWERALAAAVDEVNVSVAATDTFGLKNQGLDRRAQRRLLADIAADAHARAARDESAPRLTATVSVVWGCPFEGEVEEAQATAVVQEVAALGYAEVALADTIGVADPWTVARRVQASRVAIDAAKADAALRLHFHNTRNTGLANAYAGVQSGVEVLDASCGGIGGCPFAPGSTGNIGTEDLVYMLERAGFETGYDLAAVIETAGWIAARLGHSPTAALSRAGRFPGRAPEAVGA